MNGARFDALTKAMPAMPNRRGVLRGAAALAAGALATRHGPSASAARPWPCPNGVDGVHRDCLCECVSYGFSTNECQNACMACDWHIKPICPNPGPHGDPAGPPVCCADRKPCARVCGDCPDCEPIVE